MKREPVVVMSATLSSAEQKAILKRVRGSFFESIDTRFIIVAIISLLIHGLFIVYSITTHVKPQKVIVIENIPQRFAKLIIEKPIPKRKKKSKLKKDSQNKKALSEDVVDKKALQNTKSVTEKKKIQKKIARRSIARRSAKVEQRVRNVGVLGMLTGTGTTAKGPSVVNVLGNLNSGKERLKDLDKALEKVSGLKSANDLDVLNKKLIKSKEVKLSSKASIDNMLSGVGKIEVASLEKKGNFVIQKPQSIAGAGSFNAKRDENAVNKVIRTHKASIRMTYEKFLRRTPNLSGKVTITFTISASGKVIKVTVVENTTGSSSLASEISRKIRMWKFAPIRDGDVTVTYPFIFKPA